MVTTGTPPPVSKAELGRRLDQWAVERRRSPWFDSEGSSKDLPKWFLVVEEVCRAKHIAPLQWSDAAIFLLSGDLRAVMEERKATVVQESGEQFWKWEEFKNDIQGIVLEAERIKQEAGNRRANKEANMSALEKFRKDHPFLAATASAGLVVGGATVLVPAAGILALNAVGFTAGGVVAGSFAATVQSIFYGGMTGGLFSVLQSVGATAVLPGLGSAFASVAAVGAGAALARGDEGDEDGSSTGTGFQGGSKPGPKDEGPPPYVA